MPVQDEGATDVPFIITAQTGNLDNPFDDNNYEAGKTIS